MIQKTTIMPFASGTAFAEGIDFDTILQRILSIYVFSMSHSEH